MPSPMSSASTAVEFVSEASRRVQEDQNRADFMEFLYELDDRGNPEHPYRNSYTALFQQYAHTVGVAVLEGVAKEWHLYDQVSMVNALAGEESGDDANQ